MFFRVLLFILFPFGDRLSLFMAFGYRLTACCSGSCCFFRWSWLYSRIIGTSENCAAKAVSIRSKTSAVLAAVASL